MSAALRLVRDDDHGGGDEFPPLEAWEIYMRGAGRSERTVRDGVPTMKRLERHAGRPCDQLRAVDVSRFLSSADPKPRSRACYFGPISASFKRFGKSGGTNATADLPYPRSPKGTPRPVSSVGLQKLIDHHRTLVMILLAAFARLRVHEIAKVRGEDIDRDTWTLRVTGKGGRTDDIPMHRT